MRVQAAIDRVAVTYKQLRIAGNRKNFFLDISLSLSLYIYI